MADDFNKFMQAELKHIDDAKWYEGIRTGKDPGESFVNDWATKNAKEFRDKWNASKCKQCRDGHLCGNTVKEECENFKP